MKKAMSLLLAVTVLATFFTVPAWAEDEFELDLPVIEEVTEEEMEEELELFGEEVELYAASHMADLVVEDGYTPLTELENVSLSVISSNASVTGEGSVATLADGEVSTTGYANLSDTTDDVTTDYGYMGYIGNSTYGTQTVVLDLGAPMSFSGVRIYDSCRAKSLDNRFVKNLRMSFSDDGTRWFAYDAYDVYKVDEAVRTDFDDGYADFAIKKDGTAVNMYAQYIKFYVPATATSTGASGENMYEMEEIVLIDAVEGNKNLVVADLIPAYDTTTAGTWTWETEEPWTANYSVTHLYDGTKYGGQGNCWHGNPNPEGVTAGNSPEAEANKTVTIMFDNPTEVGGVRIYPRTDNGGASPGAIKMRGTYDGTTWVEILPETSLGFTKADVKEYRDAYLMHGRNNTFKGIQVIVTKNRGGGHDKYTCFTELEVLKPLEPRSPFGDDEVAMEYPSGSAEVHRIKGDVDSKISGNGSIIFDGKYISTDFFKELGASGSGYGTYQVHNNYCINASSHASYLADSVYIIYDLGKAYEFSGIRLYQRAGNTQNFKEGYISVSETGEAGSWVTSDKITVTPSVISDISEIPFSNQVYDINARYIKIHCTAGYGMHWAFEEVRLLQPNGNDAKTPTDIKEIFASALTSVKAVLEYEPYEITLDNAEDVFEAKAMFDDILTDEQKESLGDDIAKLEKLCDAATQLTHNVKVNLFGLNDPGETDHYGQKGYRNVSYTLYVSEEVADAEKPVTGLSYKGEEISGNYDRWTADNNGDGTVTLTLGGNYYNDPDYSAWLQNPVRNSVANYDENGYYYKAQKAISNFTSAPIEFRPENFNGTLVKEITNKEEGDHILTVTFSDGTTRDICLSAEYNWANVPSTATLGASDTADAITPQTTWKIATNLYAATTINGVTGSTSNAAKLFDGDYDANMYSATWDTGGKFYKSKAEEDADTPSGTIAQLLASVADTVWLDFGEPIDFSGIRMYTQTSNKGYIKNIRVYGADSIDGDKTKWEFLGEILNSTAKSNTVNFGKNEEYQYVKINFDNNSKSYNFLNEVVVLKPVTHLLSEAEITVDVSEADETEFTFDLLDGDDLASVKDSEEAELPENAYTFENETLTINKDYLTSLADGTYTFTVTFESGAAFSINVVKKDTSKLVYKVFSTTEAGDDNGSDDLVLEKANGAAVTKVEINGGAEIATYTVSDDNKTITIPRIIFRQSADLFALIDAEENGQIQVVVTYEDGKKTYDITLVADWGVVPEPTADFEADEMETKTTWKARVSSAQNQRQPGNALALKAIHTKNKQNWHTYFEGGSAESTLAQGHYFDIDFGKNPDPYSGFRLVQRPSGTHWANVIITAKNSEDTSWTEIYNDSPERVQLINPDTATWNEGDAWTKDQIGFFPFVDTNDEDKDGDKTDILYAAAYKADILLDANYDYRYVRIHIVQSGTSHVTADTLHVLMAKTILTSDANVTIDASEVAGAEFAFSLADGDYLASVKDSEETVLENSAYTFENGTLTINKDYLTSLADGTYTFTATFTGGQSFTLTVVKTDTSKVSYILAGATSATTTSNLVLTNSSGKAVDKLVLENGTELPFTASVDNKTLTVVRQNFRHSADLYSLLNVNSAGEVKVIAKDSNGETVKEYTVTVNSEWVDIPTVTRTEFAADEINPSGLGWKVRTSSARNDEHPSKAFAYPEKYGYQASNWHTYHSAVGGAQVGDSTKEMGTYLEIDFGETVPEYSGLRHVERIDGTTWNGTVTVWGKNDANGEWTRIYGGVPTYRSLGKYTLTSGTTTKTFDLNCTDIIFNSTGYRYVRIHIKSSSEHITANTLTVLKPTARLEGDASVSRYMDDEGTTDFTFMLPENAAGAISVKLGADVVAEENYTFDTETGVLSFTEAYVNGLSVGENVFTVTIDGMPINVTIVNKNRYSLSYVLSTPANPRGTDDLVLSVKDGLTVAEEGAVKYGEKNVAYTFADGEITIKRYDFRSLDDMFDMTALLLSVTVGEGETAETLPYTVTLEKEAFTVTGVVVENFVDGEIKPEEGKWKVTTISAQNAETIPAIMLANSAKDMGWHTGYTGNGIEDINSGRHYFVVDFGGEQSFAGFRYYARTNKSGDNYDNSGVWGGATIYGSNDGGETWTLIKSQAFDTTSEDDNNVKKSRVATVYFDETVTYKQVKVAVETTAHATAKAFTFLDSKPAPAPETGKVNVNVGTTTGGNVKVGSGIVLGDKYINANEEVIFTATPDGGAFKYWVEANTGKILSAVTTLAVQSAVGKNIKAIFADPSSFESFISFFGRNAKSILAYSYIKNGNALGAHVPSAEKLYTTGYEFAGWSTDANATVESELISSDALKDVETAGNTNYYAIYGKKTTNKKQSTITVTNGTIAAFGDIDNAKEEDTFDYDTKVWAKATGEGTFSYWLLNGTIVSYDETYIFFAPDTNITLEAVYDEAVTEAVTITMTSSTDEKNEVKIAGFLTTRYIPDTFKGEVIDVGIIYVKDKSLTGSGTGNDANKLVIGDVGRVSGSGKAVKVAFATKNGKDADEKEIYISGQHKLSASYSEELGIKARGFITYMDGEVLKTVYTDELVVPAAAAQE